MAGSYREVSVCVAGLHRLPALYAINCARMRLYTRTFAGGLAHVHWHPHGGLPGLIGRYAGQDCVNKRCTIEYL